MLLYSFQEMLLKRTPGAWQASETDPGTWHKVVYLHYLTSVLTSALCWRSRFDALMGCKVLKRGSEHFLYP